MIIEWKSCEEVRQKLEWESKRENGKRKCRGKCSDKV